VGDKTTLVLAPLVAAAGVPVAKMSGRGLGHTGGTLDKLESFSRFSVDMTREAFIDQVNRIGVAIVGQTENLTPADKQLYALRDVTATVDSIPLIASSVMSKKLAAGADVIVLDVKVGSGAFMKTEAEAFRLARTMVEIGNRLNRKTIAVVSDMNQPLGQAVGNALEVREAIDTLKGDGPEDVTELCLELASHMLVAAGKGDSRKQARQHVQRLMKSGKALEKLKELVRAQGGDDREVDEPDRLPQAPLKIDVRADQDGVVDSVDAEQIGMAAMSLGAGRETKGDVIDLAVGIVLHKKIGDAVHKGEPVATIHANDASKAKRAVDMVSKAVQLTDPSQQVTIPSLIYGVVD
ncbi:MAG: thymidine phosphorylase, partial [Novibacillus thermophilus]